MSQRHDPDDDRCYRDLLDAMVTASREGQGQVAARRVREGVWNRHATAEGLPEQHEVNQLLARLPGDDRAILARLLAEAFVEGLHAALVVLHEAAIPPFDRAYEGTPAHDVLGRLAGWAWPERPRSR